MRGCSKRLERGEEALHDKAAKKLRCVSHGAPAVDVAGEAQVVPTTTKPGSDGLPVLIAVRYAGRCTACGADLPKGAEAFWVKHSRVLVCPRCTGLEVAVGFGAAGTSAGRLADGAARAHAERLLAAYPMLGAHLLENAEPTALMRRWDRGADGERVVGSTSVCRRPSVSWSSSRHRLRGGDPCGRTERRLPAVELPA